MATVQGLKKKIDKISQIFNINAVVNTTCDTKTIISYYKRNIIPYFLFHSREGFVHMGISKNEEYNKEDVLEQAKIISEYIQKSDARTVLELATGKGANLKYLSEQFDAVNFTGLDLPNGQVIVAIESEKNKRNVSIVEGDYHNLGSFADSSFDVVFIIEALCHSNNKKLVAEQVYRILKKGGYFVIFDGYLGKNFDDLDETQKLAVELTQKSMAVDRFEKYDDVVKSIVQTGFIIEKETDFTLNILPSLYKFEKLSNRLFFNNRFGRLIKKVVSEEFARNTIAGCLLPDLVKAGLSKYYLTVFIKK